MSCPVSDNRAKASLARKTEEYTFLEAIVATAPLRCQKMSKRSANHLKKRNFFNITAPNCFVGFLARFRSQILKKLFLTFLYIFLQSQGLKNRRFYIDLHTVKGFEKLTKNRQFCTPFHNFQKIMNFFEISRFLTNFQFTLKL